MERPMESPDRAREALEQGLELLRIPASPRQVEALWSLVALVEAWAPRVQLTGRGSRHAIVVDLVLDAAALLAHAPAFASLADLGSGAGFPGLPVAVLRPEARVTLVESRQRRHHFQRLARRELGLANVAPRRGRAEVLDPSPHEAVVARAMARPARAIEWMLPWTAPGGWLLIPGGPEPPRLPRDPRFAAEPPLHYTVPGRREGRTLWRARRTARGAFHVEPSG